MPQVIVPDQIFTGVEWLHDHAVVVEGGRIKKIIPASEAPDSATHYTDAFLAPAFIDVQVYGAEKKLFAAYPSADTLAVMQESFSKEGTCLFQPTLATNSLEVFRKCIDAVREYLQRNGKGVIGLHLEGPWINPEKRGAHIPEFIHSPTVEEVKELLEYGKGVIRMITLAPEVCSDEVINLILSHNIIISAGHSNATYAEATRSFENGISGVTHLFNAMSPLHHRSPGLTGAALNNDRVMASIIPDGHHVDFEVIALANKIMKERLFAITDAVTETSTGPYRHQPAGDKYECNGTLSGSALTMYQAFLNLVNKVGIEVEEAIRMCSLYPAQVLRCDHFYGKIAPQAAAQFVILDTQFKLVEVIT